MEKSTGYQLTERMARYICDALCNWENTSDAELREHFAAEGVPDELLDQMIADRPKYATGIPLAEEWVPGATPLYYQPH